MRKLSNPPYARLVLVLAVSVGCLFLAPDSASAQAIGGTVADSTGAVLPGVTVEARSPAIIEQVRTVVTDGSGQYLIVALEPGAYTVTFGLPGFNTVVREGIQLRTGFTASVDVQMSVGDIQETVTVSGASPVVDIQNVDQRQVVDREVIESVPTGKSMQSYALLVPGMGGDSPPGTSLSQDAGGLTTQSGQKLRIHGGDFDDQTLDVAGMDVTDPNVQGYSHQFLADGNFEEVSVEYSAHSAEVETGGVRINMIPREGSNQFSGSFFSTFSFKGLHANNVDQDLRDRGLETGTQLEEVWLINPSIGGPIVRDRLWFFLGHTTQRADLQAANTFINQDPSALAYVADLTRPSIDGASAYDQTIHLTWQATARDKIKLFWSNSSYDKPRTLQGNTLGALFIAPEAAIQQGTAVNTYQATWTRPQTNRLLFEAGVSHTPVQLQLYPAEDAVPTIPGILDAASLVAFRNMSSWFSGITERNSPKTSEFMRASMSYVTGSHNLKIGMTMLWIDSTTDNGSENDWTTLLTLAGRPLFARFWTPGTATNELKPSLGIYAQDQWTIDRLTVNAGLRFDYFKSGFPDQTILPSAWQPESHFVPAMTAVAWRDFQPRLGVAYDLRGDGRTALKASANRYGTRAASDWAEGLNPGLNNRRQQRLWSDLNGDGFPQGDPLNPAPNGELLTANPNPAFGQPIITTFYDSDWAFGWGNRFANWELSASVQQELTPGVSLDVGYFRRNYVNFSVEDNRAVAAGDYDEFSVTVPSDPRLPDGGGSTITLVDINPGAFGRLPDNITTNADAFGGESQTWNGLDVTIDARLQGILLQGGLSTGTTSADYCALRTQAPETIAGRAGDGDTVPVEFCNTSTNWLTQLKLLGSYTFPYDILVAATLQSQAGPERFAYHTYTASVLDAALGRPHTDGAATVSVLEPGTDYGERYNQFDLRLTKIFNVGGSTRLRAMFDLFNMFNANSVTKEEYSLGGNYLQPVAIMPGRLAKFAFQLDF